jgi:hypothetical protein
LEIFMRTKTLPFILVPAFVAGCTGLTLGEKQPGADTFLEFGDIAVDDRTDTSFVLSQENTTDSSKVPKATLFAANPDTGAVQSVIDLTGRTDPRVLFPKPGVLVMSEKDGHDHLDLLDKQTFAPIRSVDATVRYNGTRMSPSREWVAVADNTSAHAPIHIIDTETLEPRIIPHNGDWLEAMWQNKSDRLLSIVFYGMDQEAPIDPKKQHARILRWSMADVKAGQFAPDGTGYWPKRELDIDVPGVTGDLLFSFTWVGMSPDDHWAVFPVRDKSKTGGDSYELLVLDTTTGDVRIVPNAKGPVGFTPDSATIVSYNDVGTGGDQELLLIDVKTLNVDPVTVPITGGITYFISHDGNFVVVGSAGGGQRLSLYDADNDKSTQMKGPGVGLDEFVARPGKGEMWIVDSQALFRLDLSKGEIETVATDFAPNHLNMLAKHDRLVLDGFLTDKLFFFDPDAKKTTLTAALPAP